MSLVTLMATGVSGAVAGPVTTAPSLILNVLPWHGQSMVPLMTLSHRQPPGLARQPLTSHLSLCAALARRTRSHQASRPALRITLPETPTS